MDRYQQLREMPFTVVAQALGIDLSRFKQRKGGTEWAGACPVHRPKKNTTAFSYNIDGRFSCFTCPATKGRGAIDLTMQVRNIGFQEAVSLLEPYVGSAIAHQQEQQAKSPRLANLQQVPTENPPFKSSYKKFAVES